MRSELYSERTCFEADRSALVRQLIALGNAIEQGAGEMTMMASESVFDAQSSKALTGEARAMHRMLLGLKDLQLAVERAPAPGRKVGGRPCVPRA
jgi:hypothetical protein